MPTYPLTYPPNHQVDAAHAACGGAAAAAARGLEVLLGPLRRALLHACWSAAWRLQHGAALGLECLAAPRAEGGAGVHRAFVLLHAPAMVRLSARSLARSLARSS